MKNANNEATPDHDNDFSLPRCPCGSALNDNGECNPCEAGIASMENDA